MFQQVLANTGAPKDETQALLNLLPWLGLFLLLVILLVAAIYIGKRLANPPDDSSESSAFTLQALRELHQAGKLSDEEFQKMRDAMIGQVKARAMDDGSSPSGERSADTRQGESRGDEAPEQSSASEKSRTKDEARADSPDGDSDNDGTNGRTGY